MSNIKGVVILVLALVCGVCGAVGQGRGRVALDDLLKHNPPDAASYVYALGAKYVAQGDRDEALNAFNYILQNLDSLHGPTFYQLSRIPGQSAAQAVVYAQRAWQTDTSNMEYLSQWASASMANRSFVMADSLLRILISAQVGVVKNHLLLAEAAYYSGDYKKVVDIVDNYHEMWGVSPVGLSLKRDALAAMNDFVAAQKTMQQAVDLYPEVGEFYAELGNISLRLGQDSLAVDSYQRIVALDSTSADGWILLSEYYRRRNKVTEYIGAIRSVFELDGMESSIKAAYFEDSFLDPALYPAYYQDVNELAVALYAKHSDSEKVRDTYIKYLIFVGDVASAKSLLGPVVESGLATEWHYENLISIDMYEKNYDAAIAVSDKALKAFPEMESAYMVKPYALYMQKKSAAEIIRCLSALEWRAASDSMLSGIFTMKGDMYNLEGQDKQAIKYFKKSLKLRPNDAGTLNNYAYILAEKGEQLELALSMSERSNAIEESNPTFLDTQAWVLYKMGQYEPARLIMQRVLALEAGNAGAAICLHYGDILAALGDALMAKNYYRKALEAGHDAAQISQRIQALEQAVVPPVRGGGENLNTKPNAILDNTTKAVKKAKTDNKTGGKTDTKISKKANNNKNQQIKP